MADDIEEMEKKFSGDVGFNMAGLYYIRLNRLFDYCDECALNGDINGWVRGCMALFRNVSAIIKKLDKNHELKDRLIKIIKLANSNNKYSDVYTELHEFQSEITGYMHSCGMLLPKGKLKGLGVIEDRLHLK